MSYEKDIIIVLREAGDSGLTVRKISRHIFNARNSLFQTASEKDIAKSVQRYLAYHNHSDDTIEKVGHGRYRLNLKSKKTKNLLASLTDNKELDNTPKQPKDQSLSLF